MPSRSRGPQPRWGSREVSSLHMSVCALHPDILSLELHYTAHIACSSRCPTRACLYNTCFRLRQMDNSSCTCVGGVRPLVFKAKSSQSDLTWYSLRDQTFAISSAKGLACLRAERDEKEQQNDEKKQKQMEKQKKKVSQTKGKAKPQGGVAKKSLKRKFDEVFKEEHV